MACSITSDSLGRVLRLIASQKDTFGKSLVAEAKELQKVSVRCSVLDQIIKKLRERCSKLERFNETDLTAQKAQILGKVLVRASQQLGKVLTLGDMIGQVKAAIEELAAIKKQFTGDSEYIFQSSPPFNHDSTPPISLLRSPARPLQTVQEDAAATVLGLDALQTPPRSNHTQATPTLSYLSSPSTPTQATSRTVTKNVRVTWSLQVSRELVEVCLSRTSAGSLGASSVSEETAESSLEDDSHPLDQDSSTRSSARDLSARLRDQNPSMRPSALDPRTRRSSSRNLQLSRLPS